MSVPATPGEAEVNLSSGALAVLLENHRSFLNDLTKRVGDRALAEDILQDAFVRTIGRVDDLPDEAVVPWFYRTLRNAAIDHYRRQQTATKAFAEFAREIDTAEPPPDELNTEICACVARLANTLKPDYAEALKVIDVEGTPVKTFAHQRRTHTEQGRRSRVPCPRSPAQARRELVRGVRRAWLHELHVRVPAQLTA